MDPRNVALLDHVENARGRQRQHHVAQFAERRERVGNGVHQGRRADDRAALAHPAHAADRLRGGVGMDEFEQGHVADRGQQIVLEGRRLRIAARVVGHLFQQDHADRLREAAGDLPFHHRRVDDRPAVFRGDPAQDRHEAGLPVHLDHGQMRGAGEGHRRRLVAELHFQSALEPGGQTVRLAIGNRRDLGERAGHFRGPFHVHHALVDHHALGAGIEQVRGQRAHLVRQHLRAADRRAARDHPLPAARRARTEAAAGGIALEHGDVLVAHAQPVGDALGHRRRGAVPLRMGGERGGDLAGRLDPHLRQFARHRRHRAGRAGRLDIGCDADAEITPLRPRGRLFAPEGGHVEVIEQLFEAFAGGDVL